MKYVDPRGPERTIAAVDWRTDGVRLKLSCGHVRVMNATFSYHVGERSRCLGCEDRPRWLRALRIWNVEDYA